MQYNIQTVPKMLSFPIFRGGGRGKFGKQFLDRVLYYSRRDEKVYMK